MIGISELKDSDEMKDLHAQNEKVNFNDFNYEMRESNNKCDSSDELLFRGVMVEKDELLIV